MDIDRLKELIVERERIDAEIIACVGVVPVKARKVQACGVCGEEGHTARTCPSKAVQ